MDQEQREQYHRSLEATLVEILDLLEKHRLERELSLRQASGQRELVDALLARQHKGEFQRRLARCTRPTSPTCWKRLPTDDRLGCGIWSRRSTTARCCSKSPTRARIADPDHGQGGAAGRRRSLDTDEIADIAPDLPHDVIQELLTTLDAQNARRLQSELAFPEDTVGALMDYRDGDDPRRRDARSRAALPAPARELPDHSTSCSWWTATRC